MNLTDTKILLSNYPNTRQEVSFVKVGGNEVIDIQCGYDIQVDAHQVTLQIANDLITAILTYDKVYIEGNHIWDVLQVFGSVYIEELLRADILHFIPDNQINPVMMRESGKAWRPDFFSYSSGAANEKGETVFKPVQDEWSEIEMTFYYKKIGGKEVQALLYLIDEKKQIVDQDRIKELTLKETLNDLKNEDFVTANEILRKNRFGLTEFHQLNILRLHELNTVAVTAGLLGADALKTDGEISELMNRKCISVFSDKFKDGVSSIQSILHKKGFPDLGELFYNHVIDLEDILKLRNSLQGKLFRYWAMKDAYDETQMQMDIMNSVHNVLGSKLSKAVRFIACSAIGVISTEFGIVASAIDSFVLNKILNGWHPKFFLDNVVKERIDKCIKEKEEKAQEELLGVRFKGVGRNDPCPCGSGRKFKKCHGKRV
jgi:hypothetical protein